MWKTYLKVFAKNAGQAIHVLDRYHIMAKMNKAIDQVRAEQVKRLKRQGKEPVLKHARWCVLQRPENLTEPQATKLAELLKCNLRTMRARLLREEFQRFFDYKSPYWAGRFLREWCTQAMRSQLEPMKKVARMLHAHEELLLNVPPSQNFREKNGWPRTSPTSYSCTTECRPWGTSKRVE
jgi:transposase